MAGRTGWPVRKFGLGRPWPLLADERGRLDLMSGGDASVQVRTMPAMRGCGGLLPEQVWDSGQRLSQDHLGRIAAAGR